MAEDVLGITGIVNIDDIKKTFDALISDLDRLGAETDVISARMSKALTDIANSSEKDLAAKTKAAMQVLNDAIAQTNKQLTTTPEMLKNAEQEATRLQGAVSKLESELGKTVVGSKEFNELNKQLENNREALRLQTADVADMRAAHEHAAATVDKLQSMYDTFISSLQGANEAQHEQQQATTDTTQAQREQTQATEQATEATREHAKSAKEEAQAQKDIQSAIADTQKTIDSLVEKQEKAQRRMEKLRESMEAWAQRGIEGGYITQTGKGQYKADKNAAGYNENVVANMQKIAKEYNELKKSLQEYRDEEALARQGLDALNASLKEHEQQTQQTTQVHEQVKQTSPRQELMNLRNEITMLTLQWREMTDAERASAEGQELKKKLDELSAKAANLQDAFGDVQEQIKNDANDTAAFSAVTQGLNLLISGFGAAEGAAAAFGMSEEELARAQTVIQGSLAATNFLTEAGNALQGQSALMRGISTIQTWAAAKAIDVETAAKGRNIVATKAATVAQGIFNAIAKANPYVLLATAIITVVGALAAFAIGSEKAKKAEEELQRVQEAQKAFYETYNSTLTSSIEKYRDLEHAYKRLKSEKEKTKWIKDNKDKFHELGLELKDIHDTETVFTQNTDQIIKAFDLRARAAAYAAQITKLYNDALAGQEYKVGDKISESKFKELFPAYAGFKNHIGDTQYANMVGGIFSDDFYLSEEGVRELNRRAMEAAEKSAEALRKERDEMNKQAQAILDGLKVKTYDPNDPDKDTRDKPTVKNEPKYKSAAELNDELLQLTKERIDRELELEKEGTKRWEQLQRERIAMQAEIDRRAAQKAGDEAVADLDASYKGGKSGLNEQQYNERRVLLEKNTREAIKAIEAKAQKDTAALEEARLQAVKERLQLEQKALLDYLQTYGDYEQRKLAITQDYADRIKNAKTQGERMMLERQMEDALAGLNMEKFKESINWEAIFNDLDKVSLEHLKKLKEQLQEMLNSKDISAENAKVIAEQISRINEQIVTKQKEWQSAFGLVIPELERVRLLKQKEIEAQERLNKAQKRQADALKEVAEARKKILELAQEEGITVDSKSVTTQGQSGVFQLFQNAGKDTKQLSDLFSTLGQKENALAKSTQNLAGAEQAAGQAAQSAGGSFAGTVAIIDAVIHGINDNVQAAKELFDQMELADTKFGKGFSSFAESSKYATEGWESLKNGDVIGVANGVYGSLRTLGDALGELGISGFGSSDTSLQSDVERLTQSNKDLKRAIDNLADKMDDSSVVEATGIYEQQKQKLFESQFNTLVMMQRSVSAYSNGFLGIGGHHSSSAKINEGVTYSEWNRLSQLLGKSVIGAGDFFNLTSEEMYKVATEATDIYSHIKGLADDGYEDAAQFMDSYVEYWQELQKLEKAYMQKLTSTSFDSIENDFANALLDMDSDAQTFADNFEKYMQQAIVNSLVSERYKPLLEKWYKAFGSYMRDGAISEYERQQLLNGGTYYDKTTGKTESFEGWNSMSESALAERNALRDMFNWGSNFEQEASSKAWQTMSQDTAEELNGRFTALYECGLQILDFNAQTHELLVLVQADIQQTRLATVTLSQNMTELLDVQYDNLNKLDEIIANTAPLPDMATVIEKIYNAVKNVNKK